MAAKNYICTAEGFIKGKSFDDLNKEIVIEYTDKVKEAQNFGTKSATEFMERHAIKGFVWKPYEQAAIRNMYVVEKNCHYDGRYHQEENSIEEWVVNKAIMRNESDVAFLTTKKLAQDNLLTFDEAKARALELNTEAISKYMEKLEELKNQTEK